MSNMLVRPYLRAIASGREPGGELHITLLASPKKAEAGAVESVNVFALQNWPEKIRALFAQGVGGAGEFAVKIRFGEGPEKIATAFAEGLSKASALRNAYEGIDTAWKSAIANGGGTAPWEELASKIEKSLKSTTTTADIKADQPTIPDDSDGKLPDVPSADVESGNVRVTSVIPVKQADIAFYKEFERAADVARRLAGVPLPEPNPEPESSDQSGSTTPPGDLVAARLRDEFRALIEDTEDDRKATSEWWKDKQACPEPKEQDAAAILSSTLGGGAEESRKATSTHRYGYRAHTLKKDAKKADDAAPDDKLREALAAYYAISSSPAWSRLFGFVIDVVVGNDHLPAGLSGKVKLSVTGQDVPDLPAVGTWAILDNDNFWPTAGGANCTDFVDGFVKLDTLIETGEPRHEIVTLDVRRAVEADRFYGTAAHDRPQLFHTAGLTLVDRGRARATVRTLSRIVQACAACGQPDAELELDAEDLMVGMRLDIGIITDAGTEWRSLAERTVEYRLANDTNPKTTAKLVEILLGVPASNRRRVMDQAVLTTATRLVPVNYSTENVGQQREAVVEQALGTWDGAPMAVYCGADVPILLPPTLMLDLETVLDLPSKEDLRLPPLRYGLTYRYAMRAVYAGGVSVLSDPHDERPATAPRRFLRHESVAAPIILLPEAIAVGDRTSPMDFERHESAILRSAQDLVKADMETSDVTLRPLINGRQYVPLTKRLTGKETIRVIVPPEASLDELLRQGQFDEDEPSRRKEILKGGLRKVAFGFPPGISGDDESVARFPVIKTTSKTGFDETRLERSRRLGWSSDPRASTKDGGTGDGQSTGTYAAGRRVEHLHAPYRPDPAAEALFIRFRYAGTPIPAGEAVIIQNDKLGTYPNRKPIALRIKKLDSVRNKPNGGQPECPITLSTYDGLKLGAPGGEPVALVDINLMRGDDYEADIFFLPSPEKLAGDFAVIETIGALAFAYKDKEVKGGNPDDPNSDTARADEDKVVGTLQHLLGNSAAAGPVVTARGLGVPSNLGELAKRIVRKITERTNVPEIAAFETVRLTHAVNRPAQAPALDGNLEVMRPASLQQAPAGAPQGGDTTAPTKPAQDNGSKRTWDEVKLVLEQAGSSVALAKDFLLSGKLKFHAATTGALEIEAEAVCPRDPVFDNRDRKRSLRARISGTWPRRFGLDGGRVDASVYDVYGFKDIDRKTGKVTLKPSRVRLLRIEFPSHPAALPAEILNSIDEDGMATIDLARVHALARVGGIVVNENGLPILKALQVHAFPDGRARELVMRAVAISRFNTDFLTAPFWDSPEARSRVLLRQELQATELQQIGNKRRVWLPATARPLKCEADAPVPVLSVKREPPYSDGQLTVSRFVRHTKTRVYLKRSWYSSGQGERLGIIIWPPSIFSDDAATEPNRVKLGHRSQPIDVTHLTDSDLGVAGPFVTRWGGDPIRRDRAPQEGTLIPAHAFLDAYLDSESKERNPHDPEIVTNVSVPIRLPGIHKDDVNAFIPMTATLLTYVPCFDTDREEWFVDVDLAHENATNPFVRFGLVRFQQNVISDDLRVSEPISLWTQLLPDRTLLSKVCTTKDSGLSLSLTATGPASIGIEEFEISADAKKALKGRNIEDPFADLRKPYMRMWLVHEKRDANGLRRSPVERTGARYEVFGEATDSTQSKWQFNDIAIAPDRLRELGPGTIYAYVEERDRRMPATYIAARRWSDGTGEAKPSEDPGRADQVPASAGLVSLPFNRRVSHRTVNEPVAEIDMFDKETFIESGPNFSARIEIYRHGGSIEPAKNGGDS
jgi:hypothetical protein